MATQENIKKLADLVYLAQNTGVSKLELDEAYRAVGLDPADRGSYTDAKNLLIDNGYSPGQNKTFYGNNEPVDQGAKLLYSQWSKAGKEEEIVNSTSHNKAWLASKLKETATDPTSTSAVLNNALESEEEANARILETYTKTGRDVSKLSGMKTIFNITGETEAAPTTSTPTTPSTYTPFLPQPQDTLTTPSTTTYEVPSVSYNNQAPTQTYGGTQPVFGGETTGTYPLAPVSGTFGVESQTAGLSAVPRTVTIADNTAGYTPSQLSQTTPGVGTANLGVQNVTYTNQFGQQIIVTEMNGSPLTYVPPGYSKVGAAKGGYMASGYADGGNVVSQTAQYSAIPTMYQQQPATMVSTPTASSPVTSTDEMVSSTVPDTYALSDSLPTDTGLDATSQQTETAFDVSESTPTAEAAPVINYPEGYTPVSFGVQGGTKTVDPFAQYVTQQDARQKAMQARLTRAEENRGRLGQYESRLEEVQSQIDALNPVDEEGNPVVPEYRNVREQREAEFLKASRMRDLEREKADIERRMAQEQRRYDRRLEGAQRDYSRRVSSYEEELARDRDREINNFARNLVRFQQEEAAKPAKTFERMSRDLRKLQSNVAAAEQMLSYGNYDNWAQAQIARNPNAVNYQDSLQQAWNTTTGQYQQNKQMLANNYGPNSWYGQYATSMQQTGQGIPLPSTGQDRWISELGMSYSDYLKYMQNPDQVISPSERMGKQWQPSAATKYGISFNDVYNFLNTKQANTQARIAANTYAKGGQVQDKMLEAKYRIASMNGYSGPKTNTALNAFANASPAMTAKFNAIGAALAKGGYMRKGYDGGGLEDGSTAFSLAPGTTVGQTTTDPTTGTTYKWNGSAWEVQGSTTPVEQDPFQQMQASLVSQTMQPIQAPFTMIQPTEQDFVPATAGQTAPVSPFAEAATVGTVQQAGQPVTTPAATTQAASVSPEVQQLTAQTQAAQGTVSEQAQVQAAQQQGTSVAGMQAAQGVATMVDSPAAREIQQGELISGVANAERAAAFNEQIQAAEATPSKQATVQGQLETLMAQFEGGNRPAWAAASMRNATAVLAARGLGASSMAGQAVIQAAMEAALPIAQMDAQVQAQFEAQNLSNRQQRAMLAAQQRAEFLGMEFTQEFQARVQNSARIGDIANMNFTAEQQIALENSRAANTMNLNNLSNRQALVMAEAAALSQLDMANLNNRQQAAVQNAQNFMQMDMTNLGNMQQTALFNAQQNIQALFTDQAAENASRQFNASSENQTNQFFASLSNQTAQFNAAQQNAMDQFNVNSVNALREFNSSLQQQRDMFNAQNGLVVAQANAQWRQNIATINTATQNQSNMDFAKTINALTSTNLDQIWQRERDLMSFAFTSSENSMDRALKIILGDKQLESVRMQLDAQEKAAKGSLFTRFLFGSGGAGGGGLLGKLVPGLGF